MALADLLGIGDGALIQPPRPAYGGFQFDLPQTAPAAPQVAAQAQPQHQPSKLRNFLGAIGDALLVSHGQQPLYRQRMADQRQQQALQGFLTNPDQAIAQLMQVDAPSAISLYKAVHPPSETPQGIKEFEYAKANGFTGSFADFVKLTHPGLVAPITLGPNDSYDPGTGDQSAGEVTATGPNGEKIRLNPQTGQWEPMGGQTASPSGGFPVNKVMDAITTQESGGVGTAVSLKGALGSTQLMPATAKEMAGKLGLPFRPDMLRSNDPAALRYQRALAEAYFNEGLQKTGSLEGALAYYHGGPDPTLHGPKTRAYVGDVLARLGPSPIVPGNIDIHNRPVVHNRDGSISTVRSISIGTDQGEVLIPTVVGGRVVSNDEAIRHYQQTGEHLGIFRSPAEATAYAKRLHDEQAQEYGGGR